MSGLPFQQHGGERERAAAALGADPASLIDLSVSLNPFAPDVATIAADHLDALRRYPEPAAAHAAFAAATGFDPELLVLTNGGAEAIAGVARLVGSGSVVGPEFSLYRRHLGRLVADPARRWRSNPSSPLGVLAADHERAAVWDEAFHPLATGCWSRGDGGAWRLGSLTKLWSCPGLRLGYAVAPDATSAARLRADLPHWSVGSLALALVEPLLDLTDLDGWSRAVAALRHELAVELAALGFTVHETAANWLLVDCADGIPAAELRQRLARHGVLVRDCTSFGLPETIRVGLPFPDQLDRVVAAFAAAGA